MKLVTLAMLMIENPVFGTIHEYSLVQYRQDHMSELVASSDGPDPHSEHGEANENPRDLT